MIDSENKEVLIRKFVEYDFALFGADHIAYVKPMLIDGQTVYSLNSADGRLISMQTSEELASTMAKYNDLEPFNVH